MSLAAGCEASERHDLVRAQRSGVPPAPRPAGGHRNDLIGYAAVLLLAWYGLACAGLQWLRASCGHPHEAAAPYSRRERAWCLLLEPARCVHVPKNNVMCCAVGVRHCGQLHSCTHVVVQAHPMISVCFSLSASAVDVRHCGQRAQRHRRGQGA